ncbi:hypothetical protein BDF14DRAFT_1759241 [Spinellus fusiger]|nr:hypothetical protein BDF14DRAFT_1759241 [Spinellus fusiger]
MLRHDPLLVSLPSHESQSPGTHSPTAVTSSWPMEVSHAHRMTQAAVLGYKPLDPVDALDYLQQVKRTLDDTVYQGLMVTMREFKLNKLTIVQVIENIAVLFKDAPLLISGFNAFLPPGYRLKCSHTKDALIVHVHLPTQETKTVRVVNTRPLHKAVYPMTLKEAYDYIHVIKARCGDETSVYQEFLDILRQFQRKQVSIQQVHWRICHLFQGEEELIKTFCDFMPESAQSLWMDCESGDKGIAPLSDLRSQLSSSPAPDDKDTFFTRAKKHIGNKVTYDAFLRVINLFNQNIIDATLAVHRVEGFLGGNPDLFDRFKQLLGYQEPDHRLLYVYARAATPDTDHEGASGYRIASLSWRQQKCSGKDLLCWEVLNTDYVSHPTWASEDSGFTASKKNQYEEALYGIEEQRYACDMDIQFNTTTILFLQGVTQTLKEMKPEERETYTLPADLGPSPFIYLCALGKAYGEERGKEMHASLQTQPAHTVPSVLKRLEHMGYHLEKEKEKQALVWKETERRNYYRALDHKGIHFKQLDKKATSVKHLITEIEALRLERATDLKKTPTDGYSDPPDPQYTFELKDKEVLRDVGKLLLFVLEHHLVYGVEDCERIKGFLCVFLPALLDLPGLLDSPNSRREEKEKVSFVRGRKTSTQQASVGMGTSAQPMVFGKSGLYCFVRLFQMVYHRLLNIKAINLEYKKDDQKAKYATTAEVCFEAKTLEMDNIRLDLDMGYYALFLDLLKKLLKGDIEQYTFENATRYVFGIHAYPVFTMDRLLFTMMRQIYPLVNDVRMEEWMDLFQESTATATATAADSDHERLGYYRRKAEKWIGLHEDLYSIAYNPQASTLALQLLRRTASSSSSSSYQEDVVDDYEEYCTSFMDWRHGSEGGNKRATTPSMLHRNLVQGIRACSLESIYTHSGLKYKLCRNTYHLFHLIGTEDVFIRQPPADTARCSLAALSARCERTLSNVHAVEAQLRQRLQ